MWIFNIRIENRPRLSSQSAHFKKFSGSTIINFSTVFYCFSKFAKFIKYQYFSLFSFSQNFKLKWIKCFCESFVIFQKINNIFTMSFLINLFLVLSSEPPKYLFKLWYLFIVAFFLNLFVGQREALWEYWKHWKLQVWPI